MVDSIELKPRPKYCTLKQQQCVYTIKVHDRLVQDGLGPNDAVLLYTQTEIRMQQ